MAKSDLKKSIKSKKSKKTKKSVLENVKDQMKVSKKELLEQVNTLSKEIGDFKEKNSSKKIIKKLEKKYKKEKANLKKEFNEQIDKLQTIQSSLLDNLPKDVLNALNINGSDKKPKKQKPSLTKKVAPAQTKSELAAIKGIGPVTLKKLQDAGITSFEDIIDTPEDKADALKAFENTKGFQSWKVQAKELIAKR